MAEGNRQRFEAVASVAQNSARDCVWRGPLSTSLSLSLLQTLEEEVVEEQERGGRGRGRERKGGKGGEAEEEEVGGMGAVRAGGARGESGRVVLGPVAPCTSNLNAFQIDSSVSREIEGNPGGSNSPPG